MLVELIDVDRYCAEEYYFVFREKSFFSRVATEVGLVKLMVSPTARCELVKRVCWMSIGRFFEEDAKTRCVIVRQLSLESFTGRKRKLKHTECSRSMRRG